MSTSTQLAAEERGPSGLKSKFQMQRLAEPVCYLVHFCLRYIAGGIAAVQSEDARAAQVSLQAGLAGDDVEVNALKAFRFGEQRDVGLAAADHIAQRGADGSEQWSRICGFIGGQVIEREGMTARDKHGVPAPPSKGLTFANPPTPARPTHPVALCARSAANEDVRRTAHVPR